MTREPSLSRFAYRLSTLCSDIEKLKARARDAGWNDIADDLCGAKDKAMDAKRRAYIGSASTGKET